MASISLDSLHKREAEEEAWPLIQSVLTQHTGQDGCPKVIHLSIIIINTKWSQEKAHFLRHYTTQTGRMTAILGMTICQWCLTLNYWLTAAVVLQIREHDEAGHDQAAGSERTQIHRDTDQIPHGTTWNMTITQSVKNKANKSMRFPPVSAKHSV